ncbi:MAG: GxxExxY protein [Isosphaeraceae bacterium]
MIFEQESYQILGACFEVYKEKGCGFLEAVYQECLEIEFELRRIPYAPRVDLEPACKGRRLEHRYQPDIVCFEAIIIEIKAVSNLCDEHRAQLQNDLKAAGFKLGFLINFGHHPLLEYERIVS